MVVLFADGSVRDFADRNNDDLINNGFAGINGFANDTIEADIENLYSAYSLDAFKGN